MTRARLPCHPAIPAPRPYGRGYSENFARIRIRYYVFPNQLPSGRFPRRWRLRGGSDGGLLPLPMHLRLTEQELATLVEMVSLAAWVASWNRRPGAEDAFHTYEDIEDKILEKALHAGFGDLIELDEETQRHRLTNEYQDRSFFQECYDEFRNESFWEELVIRLADRDLIRRIGMKAWQRLGEEQRRERTQDLEQRYWDEFARSGVDNLHVIARPGDG